MAQFQGRFRECIILEYYALTSTNIQPSTYNLRCSCGRFAGHLSCCSLPSSTAKNSRGWFWYCASDQPPLHVSQRHECPARLFFRLARLYRVHQEKRKIELPRDFNKEHDMVAIQYVLLMYTCKYSKHIKSYYLFAILSICFFSLPQV